MQITKELLTQLSFEQKEWFWVLKANDSFKLTQISGEWILISGIEPRGAISGATIYGICLPSQTVEGLLIAIQNLGVFNYLQNGMVKFDKNNKRIMFPTECLE